MVNLTFVKPLRLVRKIAIFALVLFVIYKFEIWGFILVMFLLILIRYEHPKSAARIMAEDALPIYMPRTGGEGKSVVVVGGVVVVGV